MLTYITKTENIYCAFNPELKVFAYGSCRDEALNELQDKLTRTIPIQNTTSYAYERQVFQMSHL